MSDEAQESLSDIFGGSFGSKTPEPAKGETAKPAEAAPPAAEKSEPRTDKADAEKSEGKDRSRDESGRFAKAEEKPAEPPAAEKTQEKPRVDVAAIIDERRKRQEAERRLQELLSKQEKPVERPSVFENEDAAIASRVDERTRSMREALYKLSVKAARGIYKDFGEAEQAFLGAMEKDERLLQGLQGSDDPGEYIYTMGIHVRELADVGGDLMKYRDKVTAASQSKIDEQAKQIADLNAKMEAMQKAQTELDNVPRSLNKSSSGPAPKAGEEDDEDLKSIARFNQRR